MKKIEEQRPVGAEKKHERGAPFQEFMCYSSDDQEIIPIERCRFCASAHVAHYDTVAALE